MTGQEKAERDRARAAFATNLAVLPGLGSLLMGRRSGWLQAPLALTGMALSVRWLVLVLVEWHRAGALPASIPHGRLLLQGVALFAAAWLWALATGLSMLHHPRATSEE